MDRRERISALLEEFGSKVPELLSTFVGDWTLSQLIAGEFGPPTENQKKMEKHHWELARAHLKAAGEAPETMGSIREIIVVAERACLVIRLLGDRWFHAASVSIRGNLGLVRGLMRDYEAKLLELLEA